MLSFTQQPNHPLPQQPQAAPFLSNHPERLLKWDHKRNELRDSLTKLGHYLEELDDAEKMGIHQDWRYRLIFQSSELKAPPLRKEWFLHMLMQEHELDGLITLFHEFNLKQLDPSDTPVSLSDQGPIDLIEMSLTPQGIQLAIKTFID